MADEVKYSLKDLEDTDEDLQRLREEAVKTREEERRRKLRAQYAKNAKGSWIGDLAAWYNKNRTDKNFKNGQKIDLKAQDLEALDKEGRDTIESAVNAGLEMAPGTASTENSIFDNPAIKIGRAGLSAYLTRLGLGKLDAGSLPRSTMLQKIFSPILESTAGKYGRVALPAIDFADNMYNDSNAPLAMNAANLAIGHGVGRAIQTNPILRRLLGADPNLPTHIGQTGKTASLLGLTALEGAGVGAAGAAADGGDIGKGAAAGGIMGLAFNGPMRALGQKAYPYYLQTPIHAEEQVGDFMENKLRTMVDPNMAFDAGGIPSMKMRSALRDSDIRGAFEQDADGNILYKRFGWNSDREKEFMEGLQKQFGGGLKDDLRKKVIADFKKNPVVPVQSAPGINSYRQLTNPAEIDAEIQKRVAAFDQQYDANMATNMQRFGGPQAALEFNFNEGMGGAYAQKRQAERAAFENDKVRLMRHKNAPMDERSPELFQELTDVKNQKKWINWMPDDSFEVSDTKSKWAKAATQFDEDMYPPQLTKDTLQTNINAVNRSGATGKQTPAQSFARVAETDPEYARSIIKRIKENKWDAPTASPGEKKAVEALMEMHDPKQFTQHMLDDKGAFRAAIYHLSDDPTMKHTMRRNVVDAMWNSMMEMKVPKAESGSTMAQGKHLFDKLQDIDAKDFDQLFFPGAHKGLKDLVEAHKLAVNKIGEKSMVFQTKDIAMPSLFLAFSLANLGAIPGTAAKYLAFGGSAFAKMAMWSGDPNNKLRMVEFLLKKDGAGAKAMRRFWENPEVYGRKGNELMKILFNAMDIGDGKDADTYEKEAAKVRAAQGQQ